jgi:hypothetical protein
MVHITKTAWDVFFALPTHCGFRLKPFSWT